MTPSSNAVRLGTFAALCAATSAQAEDCPLENRVYNLSPTDETMNLSQVEELREGLFLHLDPVMRELQSCVSPPEIQASSSVIDYQDGNDVRAQRGLFAFSSPLPPFPKACCTAFRQCEIDVQVYRGEFTCRR